MATLKATIRKGVVNSEGLTTVQIAICHKTKTAYIPTSIKVRPEDFMGGMVIRGSRKANINAQIMSLLADYSERLEGVDNLQIKDVNQIKMAIDGVRIQSYKMISEGYDLYISMLYKKNSIRSYRTSQKVFKEFCKGNDIPIASIDPVYIQKYAEFLKTFCPFRSERFKQHGLRGKISNHLPQKQQYSLSSQATMLAHLKAVINKCINEGWVTFKVHPFAKTEIHRSPTRKNIPTAYDMQKIKNYRSDNPKNQICADMFMLTFYLGGANWADMRNFDFRNDVITYEREKVKSRTRGTAMVSIPIIPEAREIAKKYTDENGKLTPKIKINDSNYRIKVIAHELNIDSYLTFSSARKAVAQIACDLGISDNYVNYILGHSMSKARGMLDPYSKVPQAMAGEVLKALAKIIDTPERIEQLFNENIKKILNVQI